MRSRTTKLFSFRGILLLGQAALLFALGGCGGEANYKPSSIILPAHIRKIAIRPISNKTQFFGLEEKLRLKIEDEFIRDGRIPYVNSEDQADGVIIADIVRYIKEPITYDNNHVVQEFKLWVLINLRFLDRANNAYLWEEPSMEQEYRYFVETQPGGVTEDEAREFLWELFARDIVKRTIEGFGSVSGASSRKISNETPPGPKDGAPDQPAPVRTAPPSPY